MSPPTGRQLQPVSDNGPNRATRRRVRDQRRRARQLHPHDNRKRDRQHRLLGVDGDERGLLRDLHRFRRGGDLAGAVLDFQLRDEHLCQLRTGADGCHLLEAAVHFVPGPVDAVGQVCRHLGSGRL